MAARLLELRRLRSPPPPRGRPRRRPPHEEDHRLEECAMPLIVTGMHAQRPEHPRVPALLWTQTPLRVARLCNLHAHDGCVAHHAGGRSRCPSPASTRRRCSQSWLLRPVAATLRRAGRWLRRPAVRGLSSSTVPSGSHSQPSEVLAVNQAVVAANCFHRRASDQELLLQD
jgi:hypothetical protein